MDDKKKRIMGRAVFGSMAEALRAAADLRVAGYSPNIMDDELREELLGDEDIPEGATFMEAVCEVPLKVHEGAILDEINSIIEPHGGLCHDAGVIGPDHIPHRYEEWEKRKL